MRDLQLVEIVPGSMAPQTLSASLAAELRDVGYAHTLGYDPITGFRAYLRPGNFSEGAAALLTRLGLQPDAAASPTAGLDLFAETLARFAALTD